MVFLFPQVFHRHLRLDKLTSEIILLVRKKNQIKSGFNFFYYCNHSNNNIVCIFIFIFIFICYSNRIRNAMRLAYVVHTSRIRIAYELLCVTPPYVSCFFASLASFLLQFLNLFGGVLPLGITAYDDVAALVNGNKTAFQQ